MAAIGQEGTELHNAIEVLMRTKGVTVEEAKRLCIGTAKHYGEEYQKVSASLKGREALCNDAHKMTHAMQLILSGSVFWSQQSPRYHPNRELPPLKTTATTHNGCPKGNGKKPNGEMHTKSNGCRDLNSANIVRDIAPLGKEHIIAPSLYLDQSPSKAVRDRLTDVLNIWYDVSAEDVAVIKSVDASPLHRGRPAVHTIFGEAQTVNSTGYRYVQALSEVRKLDNERCVDIFCEELTNLYIGQSHDIFWIRSLECPSEDQYLSMIDGKTSGLFRMIARLLDVKSMSSARPDLNGDGDIGASNLLRNLLAQRRVAGNLTKEQKQLFLDQLKRQGSLRYTHDVLDVLQSELRESSREMGISENTEIKSMLAALEV
ncbi:Ophiobolin F synthase [Cladorrhinum sp. PSN332]|nr:Ophiobolin F synthase [Cladorrhinum sp. PSN332]